MKIIVIFLAGVGFGYIVHTFIELIKSSVKKKPLKQKRNRLCGKM